MICWLLGTAFWWIGFVVVIMRLFFWASFHVDSIIKWYNYSVSKRGQNKWGLKLEDFESFEAYTKERIRLKAKRRREAGIGRLSDK